MKQTKSTIIEKQYREIVQNSGDLDLKSYHKHKELEETLRKAGVVRVGRGPKINDPAHTRSQIYR